jgi:hypothetical protein
MATKMKNANVSQTNKAKESKQINAGANLPKAPKQKKEISIHTIAMNSYKKQKIELFGISKLIKVLDYSFPETALLLDKAGYKPANMQPKIFTENICKALPRFNREVSGVVYKVSTKKDKTETLTEKSLWSIYDIHMVLKYIAVNK